VDRQKITVWYLDSVLAELDAQTLERRGDHNVTELDGGRLTAKLDGAACDPRAGTLAVTGGASDNVLWFRPGIETVASAHSAETGPNPQGVVFDTRGRIWVADRLGDAVTSIDPATRAVQKVVLSQHAERTTLPELGEVLYYSRDLVPKNVATGPRSVYAC